MHYCPFEIKQLLVRDRMKQSETFLATGGAARGGEWGEFPLFDPRDPFSIQVMKNRNISLSTLNESKHFTGSGGSMPGLLRVDFSPREAHLRLEGALQK